MWALMRDLLVTVGFNVRARLAEWKFAPERPVRSEILTRFEAVQKELDSRGRHAENSPSPRPTREAASRSA